MGSCRCVYVQFNQSNQNSIFWCYSIIFNLHTVLVHRKSLNTSVIMWISAGWKSDYRCFFRYDWMWILYRFKTHGTGKVWKYAKIAGLSSLSVTPNPENHISSLFTPLTVPVFLFCFGDANNKMCCKICKNYDYSMLRMVIFYTYSGSFPPLEINLVWPH